MTHLELNREQQRHDAIGRRLVEASRQYVSREAVIQWTTVSLVGVLLGLYLLRVLSLAVPSPWPSLMIVAVLVPFVAMIVGNTRRLLLAATVLDIPFQWGIHLNYNVAAGSMGAIGGLGVSVTTASLLALYAMWIPELLTRKTKVRYQPWFWAAMPSAIYVALVAASMLVAQSVTFSTYEVFMLVQTLLLYIYIVSTVRTREDVMFLVTMQVISLLMESLVMFGLHFMGPAFRIPGLTTHLDPTVVAAAPGSIARDTGTFGSPNVAASFLSMLMAPAFALLLMKVGGARKALAFSALAFGGLALVLTFSRGGWLAFAVSMTIISVVAIRRRWLSPIGPMAIVAAGALLFVIFQGPIVARLFDTQAAAGRIPLITLALSMIKAHPWLGVGSNNFYIVMPQYLTSEYVGAWLYVVHNKYLLVWAETGIFALIAFVTFLLLTVYRGWQVWKRGDRFLAPLGLALTAAVVGQMVHMNFDIFNAQAQVQGLWLVAALLAAMRNIQDGEKRSGTK